MSDRGGDVVLLDRVSKAVCLDGRRADRYAVWDVLVGRWTRGLREGERWAVEDVSLSLRHGERVGVLAAKHGGGSVLAAMIGGLLLPDAGRVEVRGACVLLNQLGKGFKPMLTVWENLQFYAVILGAPAAGLEARCRRILAFAGLEGAAERRLQDLTRAQARCLAFATHLHLETQVLVLDGVSPPGDPAFQARASALLAERLRQCTSIIFTHRPAALAGLVDRVLVFKERGLVAFDSPAAAIAFWEQHRAALEADAVLGHDAGDRGDEESDGVDAEPPDEDGGGEDEAPAVKDQVSIRDVRLDGVPSAIDRGSFVLSPGQVVTAEVTLCPHVDLECRSLLVLLNPADIKQPLAAATLLPAQVVRTGVDGDGAGGLRLVAGRTYRLAIDVVVPRLLRGRFGVTLQLLGPGPPRVVKLFAFGTRTDLPPGTSAALDVRSARLAAEG